MLDHPRELAKHALKRLFGRLSWLPPMHQFRKQLTVTLYFSQRLINVGRRESQRHIRKSHMGT